MRTPGPRLLLVEDALPVLEVLRVNLESAGFMVDTARTAATALELLTGRRYAAIVIDCALPDLPSLDWLAAVRSVAPMTPLVIYAGMIHINKLRRLAQAWGAVAVLAKPFSPADLVRVVRGAVVQQPNGGGNP